MARVCRDAATALLAAAPAFAHRAEWSSARTGADAVPLTGRAAQGGSVVATETAIPGATTSVDTINPVVQVQGAFAGSTAKSGR